MKIKIWELALALALVAAALFSAGAQRDQEELSAKLIRKKFPALEPIVLNRHIAYNETVAFCEQLEQEGKAILLRPAAEVNVGRFEKDIPTLKRLYEAGYQDTVAKIDQIREFLQEETLSAKN